MNCIRMQNFTIYVLTDGTPNLVSHSVALFDSLFAATFDGYMKATTVCCCFHVTTFDKGMVSISIYHIHSFFCQVPEFFCVFKIACYTEHFGIGLVMAAIQSTMDANDRCENRSAFEQIGV